MQHNSLPARRKLYIGMMRIDVACRFVAGALVLFLVVCSDQGHPSITWELLSTKPSYLDGTIGILPNILNTVYIILATLVVVLPLGVGAAIISPNTPAIKDRGHDRVRAETLRHPSIIYGLVGMLFFCQFMNMQTSLLAGSLTLVIMNLPRSCAQPRKA